MVICEVGPRDGLQNEVDVLAPEVRAELVDRLASTGLQRVEAVSFVRDSLVPQMAGAEDVVSRVSRRSGVVYAGLVLNERGYERLRESGLDRVDLTLSATESFNQRNANASIEEGLARCIAICERARQDGLPTTVSISVAFGCPFEGTVDSGRVLELAARIPADEVVFADTIGVGVPAQVKRLARGGAALGRRLGLHLHDTRGTGLANAYAGLEEGMTLFDASIGGTGGCPFAPHATGNIATEDLVYLLHGEGIETGVDLDAVIYVARWLERVLGRPLPGRVYRAGPPTASTASSDR